MLTCVSCTSCTHQKLHAHLLDILVAVEDEDIPGVRHQLALGRVQGEAGAARAAQGEAAHLAPVERVVCEGRAASHAAHRGQLLGTPGHRSLLQDGVSNLSYHTG